MARVNVVSGVWTPGSMRTEYSTSRWTAEFRPTRKSTIGTPSSGSSGSPARQPDTTGPGTPPDVSATGARYGARSARSPGSYSNGNRSAYSSTKKSNGLITVRSATSPTVMSRWSTGSGNTSRASQFPNGSCCQFTKWPAGSTRIEYASTGVRECGAGRRRTTCGLSRTRRSNVYVVRCSSPTLIAMCPPCTTRVTAACRGRIDNAGPNHPLVEWVRAL